MKICIDPGHGGKDTGTLGTYSSEKDITLRLALLVGEILKQHHVTVIYTRTGDDYVDLHKRCSIANRSRCDYFISLHCNSSNDPNVSGSEVYYDHSGEVSEKLAQHFQKILVNINNNKDRGIKQSNYYVLKNTSMPAVLLELAFLTHPLEENKLNDAVWQKLFSKTFAKEFLKYVGIPMDDESLECPPTDTGRTSIMGESLASVDQLESYTHQKNPKAPYLAKLYLSIGREEGVRGDMAYVQALIETNFFRFDEALRSDQHNYGGIGILDEDRITETFSSPTEGIRAHIQHLKACACTERLNTPLVDPVFHLVKRGIAPYWEELDSHWITPKENYGQRILSLWHKILQPLENPSSHLDKILSEWYAKDYLPENMDLDKAITWREFLLLQDKMSRRECKS